MALEATTGWRFVVEELERIGAEVHLAEPAEAAALKGRRSEPRPTGAMPGICGSFVDRPAAGVGGSHQRTSLISAPGSGPAICSLISGPSASSGCTRCSITTGAGSVATCSRSRADALDIRLVPFDSELHQVARKQPGCRALIEQIYGVGALTSVSILAELGEVRRFENSRDVVRYGGLDITVYQSDDHRAPGHLSRQGPPALRRALYEAAQRARFPASPDRAYYQQLAARIGGNRACLALARKLLKRSYHILKDLGDQALAPVA